VHRTSVDALSSIGRWRQDLDPRLRAMASALFKPVLDELGYDSVIDGRMPGARGGAPPNALDDAPAKRVYILATPRSGAVWLSKVLGDLPGVVVEEPQDGPGTPPALEAAPPSGAVLVVPAPLEATDAAQAREVQSANRAYDSHSGPKTTISFERLRYAPLDALRELRRRLELPVSDLDLAHAVIHHDPTRDPTAEASSGGGSGYRDRADA
jgi:hypothetical protein